jgi:hypothetical protein
MRLGDPLFGGRDGGTSRHCGWSAIWFDEVMPTLLDSFISCTS